MRENRPYGSEGGEGDTFPTPIDTHHRGATGKMMGIDGTPPILLCPKSSLGGASARPLHEFRQRLSMR
jgi:hypothetical protein